MNNDRAYVFIWNQDRTAEQHTLKGDKYIEKYNEKYKIKQLQQVKANVIDVEVGAKGFAAQWAYDLV